MIIVAPYSNDVLRDWPRQHFRELLSMLCNEVDRRIVLVGAAEQWQAVNLLVRGLPANRVANMAGLWSWPETVRQIASADLVIANNSGIAHLGASSSVPTLCLFAASHDPNEWRPRGPKVVTLYCRTQCAPCGRSGPDGCRYGHACMVGIRPAIVNRAAHAMLSREEWSAQGVLDAIGGPAA